MLRPEPGEAGPALALAPRPKQSLVGWAFSSLEGTGQQWGALPALRTSQKGGWGDRQKDEAELQASALALSCLTIPSAQEAGSGTEALHLHFDSSPFPAPCTAWGTRTHVPTPKATVSAPRGGRGSLPR